MVFITDRQGYVENQEFSEEVLTHGQNTLPEKIACLGQ